MIKGKYKTTQDHEGTSNSGRGRVVEDIQREAACSPIFQRAPKLTSFKTQSSSQQQHCDHVMTALLDLKLYTDHCHKEHNYFYRVQQQVTTSVRTPCYQKERNLNCITREFLHRENLNSTGKKKKGKVRIV